MIRLYGFPSTVKCHLSADYAKKNGSYFEYSYDLSEYRILAQSVFRCDLFINTIDKDFSGELINLGKENRIDSLEDVILIKNSSLFKILEVIDTIQKASMSDEPIFPDFMLKLIKFLKFNLNAGYDIISTSDLKWNYGD